MLKVYIAFFYVIMRQKVLGIILLIFGIYLLILNPIASVLIHLVFDLRLALPLNQFMFLIDTLEHLWLWITILFAGVGVVFIKYGRRNVLTAHA